jgi:hypothetical protein
MRRVVPINSRAVASSYGSWSSRQPVSAPRSCSSAAAGLPAATLDLHGYRRQVGVAVVSGQLDGVRGTGHGLLQRPLVQVELGFGHPQPATLDAVGVPLEVPEPAAQPADPDRAFTSVEVVVEQPRRGPSRPRSSPASRNPA